MCPSAALQYPANQAEGLPLTDHVTDHLTDPEENAIEIIDNSTCNPDNSMEAVDEKEDCNKTLCHCPVCRLRTWSRLGRYCYKFFNFHMTFHQAEGYCQRIICGGHLASIHSCSRNHQLLRIIRTPCNRRPRTWIGGFRNPPSHCFGWTDCTRWNYSRWGPGEPNNQFGREFCVEVNHPMEYEKESCNSTWCRCPVHGIHNWKRYGNVCLKFFNIRTTFQGAKIVNL
ncbi:C-type lectin lectoxin-Thr1-like [Latimeria chalumnae]|uniref:C-type lectin lectoxin-Thr1-like n=1 Tax=Latimeria chalumnae TaxID=7897 RepID=UPI00313C59CA